MLFIHLFISRSNKIPLEAIYVVRLGVNNICEKESSQQEFGVQKVYIHEKYVTLMPYYDIAILRLDRPANFTTICLPPKRKYKYSILILII